MKFQDSSFRGLKVTVGTKSVTHARTHARTHAPKAICPINFFKVGGIKIKSPANPQPQGGGGGGGGGGGSGQGGGQVGGGGVRVDGNAFVTIQKKKIFFFGGGGGGVRMDVNGELKLL